MITYKLGDVLACSEEILIHGANAQGIMGSGVALAIKNAYPEAYRVYRDASEAGYLTLSSYTFADVKKPNGDRLRIYNAVTQEHYGRDGKRYVSYDAVEKVFKNIDIHLPKEGAVAIPKIGAGLGGGAWDEIVSRIEKAMPNRPVICYVQHKKEIPGF